MKKGTPATRKRSLKLHLRAIAHMPIQGPFSGLVLECPRVPFYELLEERVVSISAHFGLSVAVEDLYCDTCESLIPFGLDTAEPARHTVEIDSTLVSNVTASDKERRRSEDFAGHHLLPRGHDCFGAGDVLVDDFPFITGVVLLENDQVAVVLVEKLIVGHDILDRFSLRQPSKATGEVHDDQGACVFVRESALRKSLKSISDDCSGNFMDTWFSVR